MPDKKLIVEVIDPLGRPTVPAGSDHCFPTFRTYVRPHFSENKNIFKQCPLLARLLIWPSGSLMTTVL